MSQWHYVALAYGVSLPTLLLLVGASWRAMRNAEARAASRTREDRE